jgi:hypothetical protein
MRLRTYLSVLAFGLAFAGLLSAALAAKAADATGTWKWTFTRQNGDTIDLTLKLKQDGEKLTGAVSGFGDTEVEIKDGKVVNGAISFTTSVERNGNTYTTKYSGKLEGDTIKGKTERERNGEKVMTDWEAKRAS